MKDILEIERLKELLKGRKAEYEIFGATTRDLTKDNQIRNTIRELEYNKK